MELKKLAFGIMALLLVGGAFAGVLDYYGKIEGTADVKAPTFYGGKENKLLINSKPIVTTEYKETDGKSIVLWTKNLGGVDFEYKPTCNFYVKAKTETPGSNLTLICKYYDGSSYKEICSAKVTLGSSYPSEPYSISCTGDSAPTDVINFGYEMGRGAAVGEYFYVETNPKGDTRIEVTPQ